MKLHHDCIPCLARNALDYARRTGSSPEVQREILRQSLHFIAELDLESNTPPHIAPLLSGIALKVAGLPENADLFREDKERSTAMAKELAAHLHEIPAYDANDFKSRLLLAASGNLIDFGIYDNLDLESASKSITKALETKVDDGAVRRLQERMDKAQKILYLLDNCGEAVFDGIFMSPYREKITIAVRGQNIYNDVTREYLGPSGLLELGCPVIDNGTGYPGTILEEVSPEFMQVFRDADLIIAKGQGNFETLYGTEAPIAFILLAKCPVVTKLLGVSANAVQILVP